MKKIVLLSICFSAVTSVFAQKPFQGYIHYTYSVLGENADNLSQLMPESMEIFADKKNSLVRINGGMFPDIKGDIVSTPEQTFLLKDYEKSYSIILSDSIEAKTEVTIQPEEEVIDILGLSCRKFKITKTTETGEDISYAWINESYVLPVNGLIRTHNMTIPGIKGIAMKTMVTEMGHTVIVRATAFTPGKQNKDLFAIPEGYTRAGLDK